MNIHIKHYVVLCTHKCILSSTTFVTPQPLRTAQTNVQVDVGRAYQQFSHQRISHFYDLHLATGRETAKRMRLLKYPKLCWKLSGNPQCYQSECLTSIHL